MSPGWPAPAPRPPSSGAGRCPPSTTGIWRVSMRFQELPFRRDPHSGRDAVSYLEGFFGLLDVRIVIGRPHIRHRELRHMLPTHLTVSNCIRQFPYEIVGLFASTYLCKGVHKFRIYSKITLLYQNPFFNVRIC